MTEKRALITDLDGTVYNWIDAIAPSFRAMIHALARVTSLDESTLYESFRRVYQKHGTLEYAFAVQELDIWNNLNWDQEKVNTVALTAARGAFRRVRRNRLKLFPDVKSTLGWMRNEGILVVGYTLAPNHQAQKRLRFLMIDRYFDYLLCPIRRAIPESAPLDVIAGQNTNKPASFVKSILEFDDDQRKPDPGFLLMFMQEHKFAPQRTYLVGDSIEKDVLVAQRAGIHDIWAKYGSLLVNSKNIETIRRISTYSPKEIEDNRILRETVKPTFVINNFSELKSILGSKQLSFL